MDTSTSRRVPRRVTRLQAFIKKERIESVQLENAIPIARQTMGRTRRGGDLRLSTMRRILAGVRAVVGRRVSMDEIFSPEPEGD